MKKINDIPVVVVHKKAGKTYRLNGVLKGINQINETCTVKFSNCKVIENVPMNKIMIDEGFLDKIKELGNKVKNWFVQKVGDFFQIIDQKGKQVIEPASLFINKVIMYQKGNLPDGVNIAVGDATKKELEDAGVATDDLSIDKAFASLIADECRRLNEFWTKILRYYGSTGATLRESYRYVERQMYGSPKKLNENLSLSDIKNKMLFEEFEEDTENGIVYTMENPFLIMTGTEGIYGKSYNTEGLKRNIRENIQHQMEMAQALYEKTHFINKINDINTINKYVDTQIKRNSDTDKKNAYDIFRRSGAGLKTAASKTTVSQARSGISEPWKPLLIFGAAGIGKTQIVKQVLKSMKNEKKFGNLNMVTVNCSGLLGADVTMPMRNTQTVTTDKELEKKLQLDGSASDSGAELGLTDDDVKEIVKTGRDIQKITNAAEWWLPVYKPTGDDNKDSLYEKFYATSSHLNSTVKNGTEIAYPLLDSEGDVYTGGVVFLDEMSRIDISAQNLFTGILQRNISDMVWAKSWYMIGASNRLTDDASGNSAFLSNKTIRSRFETVHFKPTFDEFLDYIKSYNEDTDNGALMFNPQVISFIESAGEAVWFQSVETGSIDTELAEWVQRCVAGKQDVIDPDTGQAMKMPPKLKIGDKEFDLSDPNGIRALREFKNNPREGFVGLKLLLRFIHANEEQAGSMDANQMTDGDYIIPTKTISTDISSRTLSNFNIAYDSVIKEMFCDIEFVETEDGKGDFVVTDDFILQAIYGGVYDNCTIETMDYDNVFYPNLQKLDNMLSVIYNVEGKYSEEEVKEAKKEFNKIKRNGGGITEDRLKKCIYSILNGWWGDERIDKLFAALERNADKFNEFYDVDDMSMRGKWRDDKGVVEFYCKGGWKNEEEMQYVDIMYVLQWIMRDKITKSTKGYSNATRMLEYYNEWWGQITTDSCFNDILNYGKFSENTLKNIDYKVITILRNPENVEKYMRTVRNEILSQRGYKKAREEYQNYLKSYKDILDGKTDLNSVIGAYSGNKAAASNKTLKDMFTYENINNIKKTGTGLEISEKTTAKVYDSFFNFNINKNDTKTIPATCYNLLTHMCCDNVFMKYIINYCKFYSWLMKLCKGGGQINSTFNNMTPFYSNEESVRRNLLSDFIDDGIIEDENNSYECFQKCCVKITTEPSEDNLTLCAMGVVNITYICLHLGCLMNTGNFIPDAWRSTEH